MSSEAVTVIFKPTGEVHSYPRDCWELLLLRRSLPPAERQRMDKLSRLMVANAWPYSPAQAGAMDRAALIEAIDSLPDPAQLEPGASRPQESKGPH